MKHLILLAIFVAHSDINQTGSYPDTTLSVSNVSAPGFHRVGQYSIDVPVFAQPIVVPGQIINGVSRDLLIQATVSNRVYAFDAAVPGSSPLWKTVLGSTRLTSVGYGVEQMTILTDFGVISTPVADTSIGSLFVVGATPLSWTLFKLSLQTGQIQSQVNITGQFTGTGDIGDTVIAGQLQFLPLQHFQRPGLVIANSKVYVGFGGINDTRPYHGWMFAYNESDLTQAAVFCTTPSSWGGPIWMSGGAPAVDGVGNIYFTTGNDNSISDGVDLGESIVKLSGSLALLDYFTPLTHVALDIADADVSSNRVLLIPGTTKAVVSAKDFTVYVVDTGCMGHLQGSSGCGLQNFVTDSGGVTSDVTGAYGIAFVNNVLFVPTTVGKIFSYSWTGTQFNTTAVASITPARGFPGPASLSGSNGILWVVTVQNTAVARPDSGTMRALNASTLSELWNSDTTVGDTLGHIAKFVSPVVYNGRVYVPNQDGQIQVYGLN